MANDVNIFVVSGNVGQDIELRDAGGTKVANFSIATSKTFTTKTGEKQDSTTWNKIVLFGKTAEIAAQYAKKGTKVLIEGEIQNRTYENKDGVKVTVTEVVGKTLTLLGSSGAGAAEKKEPVVVKPTPRAKAKYEDDIAF